MNKDLRLAVMNPVNEGVSKKTGKPYISQDIVVSWTEAPIPGFNETEHTNYAAVTLFGESVTNLQRMNLQVGNVINADVEVTTDSVGDNVFTKVRLYNIKLAQF